MKKQLIIVGITLLLLVVGLSGCIQDESSDYYINTEFGFSINPPDGWTLVETEDKIEFYGIENEYGTGGNYMDISLITHEPGDTLNETLNKAIENASKEIANFTLHSQQEKTVNELNAYEIIWGFYIDEDEYKVKQIGIEKDDKVFFISYSSPIHTYDTYLSDFDESLSSFTIV